ncbi:hypothetical protein [Shimia thalassica]|uniref:hypothetical protein n=1 Tax=Shimia thalassica TaxID=1715693 RepID=UPI0026E2BE17|nr:hypothetical protein [Shimia thalassica]MDO6484759.1 hypothetical protein [Shimia thalassica]
MTRTHYFAISGAYLLILTISWWFIANPEVKGSVRSASALVSSIVFLFGVVHLNTAGVQLRPVNHPFPSLIDQPISPIPALLPATFASAAAAGASTVIIPPFLASLVRHADFSVLLFLAVVSLVYFPMIQSPSQTSASKEASQ